ncbi:MAG: urease accessory protein UreF [Pseudomonadota bacterium]
MDTENTNSIPPSRGGPLALLLTWFSPAFPTGGFAYSQGLESAVRDGLVHDQESLTMWLSDLISIGPAWNDSVLMAEAWRQAGIGANRETLSDLADMAEAFAGSAPRHTESLGQGTAFLKAARAWPHEILDRLPDACPLPIAAGAAAGCHGVALADTVVAFLNALTTQNIQAALRLFPLGQERGVAVHAGLHPLINQAADAVSRSGLDDLGSATFRVEIAAARHETLGSRIFRS